MFDKRKVRREEREAELRDERRTAYLADASQKLGLALAMHGFGGGLDIVMPLSSTDHYQLAAALWAVDPMPVIVAAGAGFSAGGTLEGIADASLNDVDNITPRMPASEVAETVTGLISALEKVRTRISATD